MIFLKRRRVQLVNLFIMELNCFLILDQFDARSDKLIARIHCIYYKSEINDWGNSRERSHFCCNRQNAMKTEDLISESTLDKSKVLSPSTDLTVLTEEATGNAEFDETNQLDNTSNSAKVMRHTWLYLNVIKLFYLFHYRQFRRPLSGLGPTVTHLERTN